MLGRLTPGLVDVLMASYLIVLVLKASYLVHQLWARVLQLLVMLLKDHLLCHVCNLPIFIIFAFL